MTAKGDRGMPRLKQGVKGLPHMYTASYERALVPEARVAHVLVFKCTKSELTLFAHR